MSITPRSLKFSSADDSVAQGIVCEFADTWNRHDMPGTHEVETEDVEWINIPGATGAGRLSFTRDATRFHRTMCPELKTEGRPSA
jgi:hypothetical protein